MSDPVADLLTRAARGEPPPDDGRTEVLPQPPGPVAAVLAFAGHHVVAADVDPAWVHERLPDGDLSAPVGPAFVAALADRLGRTFDNLDVVLTAPGLGAPPGSPATSGPSARPGDGAPHRPAGPTAPTPGAHPALDLRPLPPERHGDHPRLSRAQRYRSDLRAFETADGAGLVVAGRGLARRWEIAFEVAPHARGAGMGRALVAAGRRLVPEGEPVFVQVAPGNVPSLRAVLAAGGFTAIGGEILFARPG